MAIIFNGTQVTDLNGGNEGIDLGVNNQSVKTGEKYNGKDIYIRFVEMPTNLASVFPSTTSNSIPIIKNTASRIVDYGGMLWLKTNPLECKKIPYTGDEAKNQVWMELNGEGGISITWFADWSDYECRCWIKYIQ